MNTAKSIVNVSGACFDYVPVNSPGVWNIKRGESIFQHAFVRFQVQLLVMVTIAHVFHIFLKRYHFPRLTSDVLAGLILGPTFFERYFPPESKLLFPPFPNQVFASLLKIGYIFFVFLSAVRLDTSWVKRIGKQGFILGALLFAFPYTMSFSLTVIFDPKLSLTPPQIGARVNNALIYLSAFTRSQFVDVSAILMHLKITNSRLGHLALASTLLGDLGRFVYSNIQYLNERVLSTASARAAFQSFMLLSLFMLFIFVIMRILSFWFIRKTPEGKPMKDLYVHTVVVIVLFLSSVGDNMGLDYLWGPFLFGLIIPAGSPLATNLTSKLDTIVYGLLVPLLSTFCASKVSVWAILENLDDALNFQMALIAYALKLIATFLMVLLVHVSFKEALALTLILNIKGTREIGIFLSYTPLELRDLDSTSGIFLIFLLTSYAPPLIKKLYDPSKHYIGYKKKCIQYTPYDASLEILACAQKQEDALGAIKLLEISNPTKHTPISLYGLCLEELIGSDTPLLINHQLGQRSHSSEVSKSQPIIDVFNYFKTQHKKSAQLNIFTAISPLKQMHEDICWLAFDKICSVIILPFHKRWNNNGKLVSNNNDLRNLNINVLERAPCSVGILIDHRMTNGLSSIFISSIIYRVIVLFIGGADDREALAFALRMATSPKVQLTIMYFVIDPPLVLDSWENMLDSESLRNIRQEMTMNLNIIYIEEKVRDGSDTAAIVSSLQGNYDLIMVGRRHETKPEAISGLSQWTELPELGPLGDLLASPDITSTVSILVVQQQILKADHSNILN